MNPTKHYCKHCDHQSKNSSDYAKHIKSKRHLKNVEEHKESNDVEKLKLRIKQLELELELEKIKNNSSNPTVVNNYDNSHNVVNNVFVFNTQDRMNFNDFIESIPDVDTIYNCGEFDGMGTIQRQFLKLDRHVRPLILKANEFVVKNNDEVFVGSEAKKVVRKEFQKLYGEWNNQNVCEAGASDAMGLRFMQISHGMMDILNLDNFTKKIKCELVYKQTDK